MSPPPAPQAIGLDPELQQDLVDANRRADEARKSKLSVFEKELLQAWFQDQ